MLRDVTRSPNASTTQGPSPYTRSAVVSHSSDVLASVRFTVRARSDSKHCTMSLGRSTRRNLRLSAHINHLLHRRDLDKFRMSCESESLLRRHVHSLVLFLQTLELINRQNEMTSFAQLKWKRSRPGGAEIIVDRQHQSSATSGPRSQSMRGACAATAIPREGESGCRRQ